MNNEETDRVKDFGEVFTPEDVVKKMCDLYKPQSFVGIYNVVYDGYKNIILSVL